MATGLTAWQVTKDYVITSLPNQSGSDVHMPWESFQKKYINWIFINSFELQTVTSQEVMKKLYWLCIYAMKFLPLQGSWESCTTRSLAEKEQVLPA